MTTGLGKVAGGEGIVERNAIADWEVKKASVGNRFGIREEINRLRGKWVAG